VRAVAEADGIDGTTVWRDRTPDVSTAAPEESLATVATRTVVEGTSHSPVVEDGTVVGILSTTDLATVLAGRLGGTNAAEVAGSGPSR